MNSYLKQSSLSKRKDFAKQLKYNQSKMSINKRQRSQSLHRHNLISSESNNTISHKESTQTKKLTPNALAHSSTTNDIASLPEHRKSHNKSESFNQINLSTQFRVNKNPKAFVKTNAEIYCNQLINKNQNTPLAVRASIKNDILHSINKNSYINTLFKLIENKEVIYTYAEEIFKQADRDNKEYTFNDILANMHKLKTHLMIREDVVEILKWIVKDLYKNRIKRKNRKIATSLDNRTVTIVSNSRNTMKNNNEHFMKNVAIRHALLAEEKEKESLTAVYQIYSRNTLVNSNGKHKSTLYKRNNFLGNSYFVKKVSPQQINKWIINKSLIHPVLINDIQKDKPKVLFNDQSYPNLKARNQSSKHHYPIIIDNITRNPQPNKNTYGSSSYDSNDFFIKSKMYSISSSGVFD